MINSGEKWEILTDGGEETGDKSDESGAEETGDKEILYPDKDDEAGGDKDADADADKDADEDKGADKDADDGKDKDADDDKDKDAEKKIADDKAKADLEAGIVTAENLEIPEGIKANEDIQEKFLTLVNDKEMSPADKAQAFINLQQDLYAAQAEAHQDQIDAWEKEVSLDKRFIGGTGDKLNENRAFAKKAMDMVDIKGLPELMSREQTGLGSHPVIFDLFVKIGKVISEDSFKTGGAGGGGTEPKSDEQVLYGEPVKK